jgi:hypothetical protein
MSTPLSPINNQKPPPTFNAIGLEPNTPKASEEIGNG